MTLFLLLWILSGFIAIWLIRQRMQFSCNKKYEVFYLKDLIPYFFGGIGGGILFLATLMAIIPDVISQSKSIVLWRWKK